MKMSFRFDGQTVVVTGANSGIGLATVLELAAAGYDVVGTVRSEKKAYDLYDAASERGVAVQAAVVDIGDAEANRFLRGNEHRPRAAEGRGISCQARDHAADELRALAVRDIQPAAFRSLEH